MSLTCDRIYVCIAIANRTCDSFVFVASALNSCIYLTCSGNMHIYIIYHTCHIQIALCNDSSILRIRKNCVWLCGCPWICWTFYTVLYSDSVIFSTILNYQSHIIF